MSFFKTLSSLVILAFFLHSFSAHQCVHDEMNYALKVVEDPHSSHSFTKYAATEYRNINMAFDFTNLGSANSDLQTYIKETLLPPVRTFWEATLQVPPKTSRIYVPPEMCSGLVRIPSSAYTVGYSGDIVIFVAAVYDSGASYLAKSMPCGVDKITNRPTIGLIIFNTYYINLDMKDVVIESDISTTLHEITHVLGFSKLLYPLYVNHTTLEPLTGHLFNKTVNGVPTMVLDLPPLTKRLRAHFNCSTLEGAYLENEGGSGSFGAHFERRIFFNEFMTASDMKDQRFSEFTLALLEGTGWYKVNYDHAEPMTYGKNKGCAFLDTKCVNPDTLQTSFKEFCNPLTGRQVSWTRRGFGYCGSPAYRTSNSLMSAFDYWGNKTVVVDSFADNCPQVQVVKDYDCEDRTQASGALLGSYEYYGIGAHSFAGTMSRSYFPYERTEGYCFKSQCVKNSNGNYTLKVRLNGKGDVVCNAAGEINANDFNFYNDIVGIFQCPDPNEFCEQVESEGFCKGGCFGNGFCHQKECHCMKGWGSHNCASRKLVDQCSRCTADNLRTTCYGDACVCNPSNTTCQCLLGLKTGVICGDSAPDHENTNSNPINYPTEESKSDGNGNIGALVFQILLICIVIAILVGVFTKKKQPVAGANQQLSQPIIFNQNDQSQTVL